MSWLALFITSAFSSATDQSGWIWRRSAIVPAMCGVAIEVPLKLSPSVPDRAWVEKTVSPTESMSGFSPLPTRLGPRELNEAIVSSSVGWMDLPFSR